MRMIKLRYKSSEIVVREYSPENLEIGSILLLHGGGESSALRLDVIAKDFAMHGLRVISFDHTGHGDTGGSLLGQSLKDRLLEASAVFDDFVNHDLPVAIMSFSMGAYPAVEIASSKNVSALVLCAPAAYSNDSVNKKFGPEFKTAITDPNSWQNSKTFDNLQGYDGDTLLVLAGNDKVIPKAIYDRYIEVINKKGSKGKILVLKHAKHQLGVWLTDNPIERNKVVESVLALLK